MEGAAETEEKEKIVKGAVSRNMAYSPLTVRQQNIFVVSRAA